MAFNVTVKGFGSFTATVNGEQAVLAAQVMDQSALMALMAAQGAKGDKGDTGATGATGATGPQGPQGNPGAAATVNAGTTTTGAAGSSASVVNVGTTSAAIFDFTIPRGDKGEQGIQGIQGIQGPKGDTGDSGVAYATAPIQYDSLTKTVSIDPAYKPNPFDQSLNAADEVAFRKTTLADGGPGLVVVDPYWLGTGITHTVGDNVAGMAGLDGFSHTDGTSTISVKASTGITFPDSTVQTTAYTGQNPFDQSLNTTDSPTFDTVYVGGGVSFGAIGGLTQTQLTLSSGGSLMLVSDTAITFPDATVQTTAAPGAVDIQTFGSPTESGTFTWTKPAGAKMVQVRMVAGGGGGQSGVNAVTTNDRKGGNGGGGGSSSIFFIPADELGSTVSVTVGFGGTGGASVGPAIGSGSNGIQGGASLFGNYRSHPGGGGAAAVGNGAVGSLFNLTNSASSGQGGGGSTGGTGALGGGSTSGTFIATGGGGGAGQLGGSMSNANGGAGGSRTNGTTPAAYTVTLAGGAGGASSTNTPATNGTNQDVPYACGTGGGGGYYKNAVNGNAGGNGGWPGGGGGGGGACDSGYISGKGGNGANGMVTVITYF